MKRYILCLVSFISALNLISQRNNNWYFGTNAGLSFAANPPAALSSGQSSILDYNSTMSDKNGNLLFYTDGMTVWNKNHIAMPNGTGLTGNTTAGQCGLIVPVPCDPNRYVIFHLTDFANPGHLNYTVVDMTLAGGLGDVVAAQKNVSLGTGWTEKMCAYYNPAANNYWILVHKSNSKDFVAFSLTANAIATQSVVSSIGTMHNSGAWGAPHDAMGELTISPDGSKVVVAVTDQDILDVFDFNVATGVVSNSVSIPVTNGGKVFGAAFSPNGTKIYVDGLLGTKLYQYDISNYNQGAILASQVTLTTTASPGILLYMELGPDNKLYVAKEQSNSLAVINSPDVAGTGCNLSFSGVSLGGKLSRGGLSRIAYNIPKDPVLTVTGPTLLCTGGSATLQASGTGPFTWSAPGSGSAIVVSPTNATSYFVSEPTPCGVLIATITVQVSPVLNVGISGPTTVCSGEVATLYGTGASNYTWSTGQQSPSITISPQATGVYTVSGSSGNCYEGASFTLAVIPMPTVNISGPLNVCMGQSISLSASGAGTYTWSTGQHMSSIAVSPTTTSVYTVAGSSGGCVSGSSLNITVHPLPVVAITGPTLVCRFEFMVLKAGGALTYSWSNGAQASTITVLHQQTTTYTVTGTDAQGCKGEATHTVKMTICEFMGMEDHPGELPFRIYPNPVQDVLMIEANGVLQAEKLEIYTVTGEKVVAFTKEELEGTGNTFRADFGKLNKGTYFLKLGGNGRSKVYKVVKE